MKKYIDLLKDKISKERLIYLYLDQKLSKQKIAETFNICINSLNNLLKYYNLSRDLSNIQSENNSKIKNRYFEIIKQKITKENIYEDYICKNLKQIEIQKKYNISNWTLNRLLKSYDIHKPKKISSKIALQTKYNKYGSREAYYKHVSDKQKKTCIKNNGSLENHYKKISEKCSKTWNSKSQLEKDNHTRNVMLNGGGWCKSTIQKTVQSKYGVDNISKLPNIKQKAKINLNKICLKKYGVAYNCLLPQCLNAIGSKSSNTKPNIKFAKLLEDNNIAYAREFSIDNKAYDFKVDNILIEINPFATHNSNWSPYGDKLGKDINYHYEKSKLARTNNYRCIQIWDWDDEEKIIQSLKNKECIYARKCMIKEVKNSDCDDFLNSYHLQNTCKRQVIRLGLYYNNDLIQIMTFGKPRYNKNFEYELLRLCTRFNYKVIGGSEKLFNYFVNTYNPKSIISYCDMSKFDGKVYFRLGFKLKYKGAPTRHWFNPKTRYHITDNLLRQRGFDQLFRADFGKGTNNNQLMRDHGFVEIYDCGQDSFEWIKQ